jgi:uncharacterized protein
LLLDAKTHRKLAPKGRIRMSNITVSGLFVYPIKGARGIEVTSARAKPLGFEHDRRFLLTDPRGQFVTQREYTTLALVQTQVSGDTLIVHAPNQEPLTLPLRPEGPPDRTVQVWGTRSPALFLGQTAADYFSTYFGAPVELVFMPENEGREVDPDFAKNGEKVSFADGFPYLLATEESLDNLNARLVDGVPMNRFRPNIVVRGAPAWAEDYWSNFSLNGLVFHPAKPCARCQVITVNQDTGVRGKDPLATLATFRARSNKVYFGWNLFVEGEGVVNTGDRMTMLA